MPDKIITELQTVACAGGFAGVGGAAKASPTPWTVSACPPLIQFVYCMSGCMSAK